jgi:hypothetical protein
LSIETFFLNAKNTQGLIVLLRKLDLSKLHRVRIDEYDEKTRIQEEKYHAMIGDVARQAKHLNQVLDTESWKRLLVAQFRQDSIDNEIPRISDYWKRTEFRLMPSLDGRSLVTLGAQTRDFPKYVAAGFIEWLYHYGAENNVDWSEPEEQWDMRYAA